MLYINKGQSISTEINCLLLAFTNSLLSTSSKRKFCVTKDGYVVVSIISEIILCGHRTDGTVRNSYIFFNIKEPLDDGCEGLMLYIITIISYKLCVMIEVFLYHGPLRSKSSERLFIEIFSGTSPISFWDLKTTTHHGMASLWISEEEIVALAAHFEYSLVEFVAPVDNTNVTSNGFYGGKNMDDVVDSNVGKPIIHLEPQRLSNPMEDSSFFYVSNKPLAVVEPKYGALKC
ncbi:hypothetical protein M5K25_020643 [Dendrobium thyrsiflorum]|uniref:Uncharacterized protein n=1 Tax=Dendrobium thyrsiflorum TaxID=117978 RepID=A0ABD0UHE7_DENTH